MFKIEIFDSTDCLVAIQAAVSMSERFREDIAILSDLSVVKLSQTNDVPLEIVKYQPEAKGFTHE